MSPVAGALTLKAALGAELAAPPAEADDEEPPDADRDEARDIDIDDIVVGVIPVAPEAEALASSAVEEPAAGAAPDPPPDAETAPRAAASPVAAIPPPEAVKVGAWYASTSELARVLRDNKWP